MASLKSSRELACDRQRRDFDRLHALRDEPGHAQRVRFVAARTYVRNAITLKDYGEEAEAIVPALLDIVRELRETIRNVRDGGWDCQHESLPNRGKKKK